MPPKRKAAAAKGKAGGKKAKADAQAAGDDVKSKMAALKRADSGKKTFTVDSHCPYANSATVSGCFYTCSPFIYSTFSAMYVGTLVWGDICAVHKK